jgi:hypothetical protein
MEAKELVDAGVCASMAEGRQKALKRINGSVVKLADTQLSKSCSLVE